VARQSLEALPANEGYLLNLAIDGKEGLSKAVQLCPDAILLDLMMAAMDGFEVCHWLRVEPSRAEIPILMATVLDDRESGSRGLESGADDFLSIPIDRLELLARLRTITRRDR
jgi:DNA-binding response OmpR family regulator